MADLIPRARTADLVLGLFAILFFAAHLAYNLFYGFPANLLWSCHLGALFVGLGLLHLSAGLNGIGVLWLITRPGAAVGGSGAVAANRGPPAGAWRRAGV